MGKAMIACCPVLLLLFVGFAAAQECAISSADSDEFLLEFHINEDGTASMRMDLKILYPYSCFEKSGLDIGSGACRQEIISDALFRSMDFFVVSSECEFSYDVTTSYLLIKTTSLTEKIAEEKDDFYEIRFSKWDLVQSKPTAESTLKIILPQGSEIISYFPLKNSNQEGSSIIWGEIPSEPISLKYTLYSPLREYLLPILLVLVVLAAAIVLIARKLLSVKKLESKLDALHKEEELLGNELKELKISYLKRRISEETYQEKAEKLSIRLTEITAETGALLEKHAPKK